MDIQEAVSEACAVVGITVPRDNREGRWLYADTLTGRNGKNDGRVMIDGDRVTARNMQTGENATVRLGALDPEVKRRFVERRVRDARDRQRRTAEAAGIAQELVRRARLAPHGYLAAKGFASERGFVIAADAVREIAGRYIVPDGARSALVVPARIGERITSAQIIWEGGEKRFLAGGEMGGAHHRLSRGTDTWLCEGLATGMSLRAALRGLGRSDTVIIGFSAYNLPVLARTIRGRCFIAADHDKPMEQFDGLGTGEHCARQAGQPYVMPERLGDDFNDVLLDQGIFAVQRSLTALIRSAPVGESHAA
ncbi:hypothetical protein [Antarcticirhabdus aurantiaca]|uniref:Uncharacterized protein n=1 Tax=Antarcticirhabdus aurantiaca TaxID=2606717 RepID=A0ACD4NLC0_9HYPH|nr:hypothetical protein OXU80_22360 [Jeongeuplla avenae]